LVAPIFPIAFWRPRLLIIRQELGTSAPLKMPWCALRRVQLPRPAPPQLRRFSNYHSVWRSTWGRVQAREQRTQVRCSFFISAFAPILSFPGSRFQPEHPSLLPPEKHALRIPPNVAARALNPGIDLACQTWAYSTKTELNGRGNSRCVNKRLFTHRAADRGGHHPDHRSDRHSRPNARPHVGQ